MIERRVGGHVMGSAAVDAIATKTVTVNFEGGLVSSDGGGVLLARADRSYGYLQRFATCFQDHREAGGADAPLVGALLALLELALDQPAQVSRTLQRRSVTPEALGFPFAAQAARLTRQAAGRADETVALLTNLEPQQLDAATWLARNRQAWDIETGLHARLGVSLLEDRCRLRTPRSLWVLGRLRRLVVSLFMEWCTAHPQGRHQSLTDFHTAMGEDNLAPALRFLTRQHPSLKNLHA